MTTRPNGTAPGISTCFLSSAFLTATPSRVVTRGTNVSGIPALRSTTSYAGNASSAIRG